MGQRNSSGGFWILLLLLVDDGDLWWWNKIFFHLSLGGVVGVGVVRMGSGNLSDFLLCVVFLWIMSFRLC